MTRALGTLATAAALLLAGLPASSAGRGADLLSNLPPPFAARTAGALATAGEIRADLASGSHRRVIDAVTGASGLPAAAPGASALPRDVRREVARLAPELRGPVAGLAAAVETARSMLGDLPAAEVRAALAAAAHTVVDWQRRTASGGPAGRTGHPSAPKPTVPQPAAPRLAPVSPAIVRAMRAAPAAAAVIADALDRHLPALRAARPPATGEAGAPCDVMDHSPYLCISSSADTTYTADAMLVIDQGGNDVYRGSVAAAPFLPAGGVAYLPVAVLVDQGGNDRYEPQAPAQDVALGALQYRMRVADGAGIAGGVGILVDEAGDDVHVAEAPDVTTSRYGFAALQGASIGGVGIVLDRAGNDSYVASAPSGTDTGISFVAQGAGLMTYRAGAQVNPPRTATDVPPGAALIDLGAGNDTYTMAAGSVTSTAGLGYRGALGQGYSFLGTGILADGGGTDALSATAGAAWDGQDAFPDHTGGYRAPQATLLAQGYGLGPVAGNTYAPKGYALVLMGEGPTTYELRATGSGMADTDVWGQGFAGGDGLALVQDRGGSDRYTASSDLSLDRTLRVDDACACDAAAVSGSRALFATTLLAQGVGGVTGEGIVHDRNGNDVYEATADADVTVRMADDRIDPAEPASLRVTGYGQLWTGTQGYTGLGYGLLADESGADSYRIRNATRARAEGLEDDSGPVPDTTAVAGLKGNAKGQGAGEWILGSPQLGALVDLTGGATDRFVAEAVNEATTAPDPRGAVRPGWYWPQGFQGNGFEGLFVANGTAPRILSRPAQGICPQSPSPRGFGTWLYCGMQGADPDHQLFDGIPAFIAPLPNVWATGRAVNATGAAPSLSLTAATASSAPANTRIPVEARLLGPGGTPIAGATVRFDFQMVFASLVPDPAFGTFLNPFEVEAVTGSDGIARADLPLAFSTLGLGANPDGQFRLLATYDGADGVYPAHATSPFDLTG